MEMTPLQQAAYSIGISMGQNLNSQGLSLRLGAQKTKYALQIGLH